MGFIRQTPRYDNKFKVKLVLEVLKGEKTLNQIASEYNVLPNNLKNWKKQFLENAEIAMEPAGVTKEYKEQIKELVNFGTGCFVKTLHRHTAICLLLL